jgi:hypothetical protein
LAGVMTIDEEDWDDQHPQSLKRDGIKLNHHRASQFLIEHDLRANAFAFVARENRYPLFRVMLQEH